MVRQPFAFFRLFSEKAPPMDVQMEGFAGADARSAEVAVWIS